VIADSLQTLKNIFEPAHTKRQCPPTYWSIMF